MKAKAHTEENSRLNNIIDSITKEYEAKMGNMQSMLEDKDNLNKALTDSHNDMKQKVTAMQQEHEQYVTVSSELDNLKHEHEQTMRAKEDIKKRLEHESQEHEKAIAYLKQHEADVLERTKEQSQIQTDKQLLELERKYQAQIQELKEQKQAEVDKYQSKYFDLLEQIKK